MKVTVYTTTTLTSPVVKDGAYGAVVEYVTQSGRKEIRIILGMERKTTFHRSALLATINALRILNVPCEVELKSGSNFLINMINSGNPEAWKRAEWRKPSGKEVKNKELWQEYIDISKKHKINATLCKNHEYERLLTDRIAKELRNKKYVK